MEEHASRPPAPKALSGHALRKGVVAGLLLMALLVPLFFSSLFHEYRVPKLVIMEVLTIFLAVTWVVGMALDGEITVFDTPLYYTFLAFLAVHFISLFQAYNVFQGLDTLFQYLCYFLIAVLVFHTVCNKRRLTLLAGTMAFTGGIVAFIGLLQHNGIVRFYAPWNIPISTIGNVNFVAEYYDVVFPIALTLIFLFRKFWLQAAAVLACFLMACHLVVLNSRGGWLGAIVAFAVLGGMALFRHFQVGRRVVDIAAVGVVVLGLGWPVAGGLMSGIQVGPDRDLGGLARETWQRMMYRTGDALKLEDDSSQQRVNLWGDTVRLIFDRPLVGVGVGNYEYNIPRYMSRQSLEVKARMEGRSGRELMAFRAHNEYLEVWAETGVLGFLAFGFLLYQIGSALYGLLLGYIRGEGDLFAVGLAAAIAASLAHSFFSTNLQDPVSAVSFWMAVGMVWSLKLTAEGPVRIGLLTTGRGRPVWGVISAGGLALLGTAVFGIQVLLGDYHYFTGTRWFEAGAYDRAGAELEQAVRYRPPKLFAAYQALGLSHYNKEQWPQAVQALQKSVFYHRSNATAYYHLGRSLGKMERYPEAVAHLRRAVDLNPLSARFRQGVGEVLGIAGDPRRAIEELREGLRLDPNASEIYYVLGGNYKRIGDLEAAAGAYRQALALKPGDRKVLNSLGVVTLLLGEFEGARETFSHLAGEQPNRTDYRMNLGVALLNLGQMDSVLSQCRQILQMAPGHAGAYTLMGDALRATGEPSRARQVYLEALKRDPDNEEIQKRLKALTGR